MARPALGRALGRASGGRARAGQQGVPRLRRRLVSRRQGSGFAAARLVLGCRDVTGWHRLGVFKSGACFTDSAMLAARQTSAAHDVVTWHITCGTCCLCLRHGARRAVHAGVLQRGRAQALQVKVVAELTASVHNTAGCVFVSWLRSESRFFGKSGLKESPVTVRVAQCASRGRAAACEGACGQGRPLTLMAVLRAACQGGNY